MGTGGPNAIAQAPPQARSDGYSGQPAEVPPTATTQQQMGKFGPPAQLQPQMPSRSDASRQPPNPVGADHADVADSYEQASRAAPPSFVDGGARALQRAVEDGHGGSA